MTASLIEKLRDILPSIPEDGITDPYDDGGRAYLDSAIAIVRQHADEQPSLASDAYQKVQSGLKDLVDPKHRDYVGILPAAKIDRIIAALPTLKPDPALPLECFELWGKP